jgi:hypothetical protein
LLNEVSLTLLWKVVSTDQKVRFILEEQISLLGDHGINWDTIALVQRIKTDNEDIAFIVRFSSEKSATYHPNSPEGEALLKHWEKYAPNLRDGAERIRVD